MEFRRAGASGLHISTVAYGNFLTHGDKIDADRSTEIVRAAVDVGITTFDTADSYAGGAAEEVLGAALRGLPRDSFELSTKVFFALDDADPHPNSRGLSRKHVRESIDASLQRLGTDYLDVYIAHRFDPDVPLEEIIQGFADVVRAGKALYFGISEWPAEQIRLAAPIARELAVPIVLNQVQYSMLSRRAESDVVAACIESGIGLWAWSPLQQGVLTGKYLPGQQPPPGSRAVDTGRGSQLIRRWLTDDILAAVQKLGALAAELDVPLARLALAWVLGRTGVSGLIAGGARPEQVAQNVKAVELVIPSDVLVRIDEILVGVEPLPVGS
ncbi:aldo/keto reductase family protein [Microbacterium sp. LMI12-1-1.1]|uniref:aldo/keto reductase family protein n=1 Tax=Microbacterium sp. LMI12-1-1.1 TaxID=3135225 RepID=UPI003430BA2D